MKHRLVSFSFSPSTDSRADSSSIFFSRFGLDGLGGRGRDLRIVHDFAENAQYSVEGGDRCRVGKIPVTAPDADFFEPTKVKLRHAEEMLNVEPTQFVYSGKVSVNAKYVQRTSLNIVALACITQCIYLAKNSLQKQPL